MRRSLTARIISLSVIWIVVALLVTAMILNILYQQHIEEHYDAHVFTHLEELVAAIESDSEGDLKMVGEPTDPRFHRLNSGWFWMVRQNGNLLAKSASLGDATLDLSTLKINVNHQVQTVPGLTGELLRAQLMEVTYPRGAGSLLFIATAPKTQIADDVGDFFNHILTSFLVLFIGLSLAVVIQVRLALKPLKAIRSEIADVKAGKAKRLSQDFPNDVQPLVNELNYLLDHNEQLLKRARNQLGDLAHAVKNPLTVIRNEARQITTEQGQLILDQSHVMASSIDHCLSRARAYGKMDILGFRTSVKDVIEDLVYAVERIYHDRGIEIRLSGVEGCCFRGESQDIEEMAGNLIDNACKWAKSRVDIHCKTDGGRFLLSIVDDGPGISEDKLEHVMHRGNKLDDSVPGHGQGLGIVEDIADLYGGSLKLGRSPLGGLQADLELPAA
jgi:signal transduction histidine kinase